MKKSLFIGLFITLIFPSVFAQSGTRFLENTPWVNVLQQAKQENKLIFVDCYTSWCGTVQTVGNGNLSSKDRRRLHEFQIRERKIRYGKRRRANFQSKIP